MFTGEFTFTTPAEHTGWTWNPSSVITTECSPSQIVGGYNQFGSGAYAQQTFTILPHYKAGLQLDFYKIDKWSSNTFSVLFDGVSKYTKTFAISDDYTNVRNLCGGAYNEAFERVYVESTHYSTSLTVKLSSDLSVTSDIGSWGFNNLQISAYLCHPTCASCTDKTISTCSTCYTHASKNSSNYCNCDNGYYMDTYAEPCTTYPCSVCQPCDSSCATCFDGTSSGCITCADPTKYVNNNVCEACNATICLHCDIFSNNCTKCQTIAAPNTVYLVKHDNLNNTCDSMCPFGTYADSTALECKDCNPSCESCSGGLSTDCITCALGYYTTATGACSICDSSCYTCSDDSLNCISCLGGPVLYNHQCLASCPTGYFNRTEDSSCQQCDSSCETCSDPTSQGCTSCIDGQYLSPEPTGSCRNCDPQCKTCSSTSTNCDSCNNGLFLENNECNNGCSNSKWPDSTANTCEDCDPSCLTCSAGGDTNCIQCNSGYFENSGACIACPGCKTCETSATNCLSCNVGKYLEGNTCVSPCPDGKWGDDSDNTCKTCDSNCKTCSGAASNDCDSCVDGRYLNSGECLYCSSACKTCDTTAYLCTSCETGSFLMDGSCLAACASGYWADSSTYQCELCDSSCETCDPPGTNSDCLTCSSGRFKSSSGQCLACDSECETCETSSSNCLSCTGTRYFLSNKCLTLCDDGYYGNTMNNLCTLCNAACLTCNGGLASNCLTCPPLQILKSGKCFSCHSSCATCDGTTSIDCLSCNSPLVLQGKSCIEQCNIGYYRDLSGSGDCLKCSSTCTTCISSGIDDCLTCPIPFFFELKDSVLKSGACHNTCPIPLIGSPNNYTCISKCDSGTYNETSNNQCKACHSLCKTCYGGKSTNCLSCHENFLKKGTTCVTNCPLQYFANNSTKTCDECLQNCLNCSDRTSCNTCNYGYFLRLSTKLCSNSTNEAEYIDYSDYTIKACGYGCFKCKSNIVCTTCSGAFYLVNSTCYYKRFLQPQLSRVPLIPNVFYLSFNDTWTNFFNNLTKNSSSYSLELDYIPKKNYEISLKVNGFNNSLWEISIDFRYNCPDSFYLDVKLFPFQEALYNLTTDKISIFIDSYYVCYVNNSLDNGFSDNCTNISLIDFELKTIENNPLALNLKFTKEFPDFFSIINNISSINIANFTAEYNFSLNSTSNTEYLLTLQTNTSILENPLLTLSFDLPAAIIYHPFERLTKTWISINLLEFYLMTDDTISKIEMIKDFDFLLRVFPYLAFCNGIIDFSSISFIGIQAVNIIRFIRYIDANYPPQALAIFQMSPPDIFLFPNGVVEKDSYVPENFKKYYIDGHFLRNSMDKLAKLGIVLFIGLIVEVILRFGNPQKPIVFKTLDALSSIFFLNIPLMFFLSFLMDFCLFAYLNIHFSDFSDEELGIFNYAASIFFIITIITMLYKFFIYFFKTPSAIAPFYQNLSPESPHPKIKTRIEDNEQEINKGDIKNIDSPTRIVNNAGDIPGKENAPKVGGVRRKTWWDWWKFSTMKTSKFKKETTYLPKDEFNETKKFETLHTPRIENNDNPGESPLILGNLPFKSTKTINLKEIPSNNRKYKLLIKDFQNISRTQRLYVVFLMMRYMLLPAFIVGFYNNSYAAISLYMVVNVYFLIYILCIQPFRNWTIFFENVVIELLVLIGVGGGFLRVINMNAINLSLNSVMIHGWMIFYGNCSVVLFCFIIYSAKIILLVKNKMKGAFKKKNKVAIE